MINVLSHIYSFDDLFAAIAKLLHRKGKIILKTGELEKGVRKYNITDWGIPDHLHFLGMNTVNVICRKYGYKIIKHLRIPLTEELFSRDTWRMPGRSNFRNSIKQLIVRLPFALPIMAKLYDAINKRKIYSSFIVLSSE